MSKPQAFFMSVEDFKTMLNITTITILEDKETHKKSFKVRDSWFKVQSNIDVSKPIRFITDKLNEDGTPNWMEGGLCNIDDSNAKKVTFGTI
jgi:hypothetical protein